MDVTTVADDLVVIHDATTVHRFDELTPDTSYRFLGQEAHTLPRPRGELVCRIATVNDVHFGEVEAGRIDDLTEGPIQRAADDEAPYPETMNRGAADEIAAIDPAAVVVKGDLTMDGSAVEWAAFEACYRDAFGERLHVVRGNHDAYRMQTEYAGDQWIELPGVAIALLDTVIPGKSTGGLTAEQMAWLDDRASRSDVPVIVMGHHQQWISAPPNGYEIPPPRGEDYFGINPDSSDRLAEVCARRRSIVAYTAGHTHRHRVRMMVNAPGAADVPSIEIGCVKDFPGTWAEYRVYDSGDVMQVVHRISTPAALSWSERCRHLYRDFGIDYESYALGTLADRCFTLHPRFGHPAT